MALVSAVNIFTSLNSLGQVVGRQMAVILTVSHGRVLLAQDQGL